DRHPERDEIVVGGSDGTPKIYRVFRITARKIGDDSNLIRELTPMTGRVFGVAVSPDGTRIAAVSALDGRGQLSVYSYEFDTSVPDDIKAINSKRIRDRKPEEQQKLDEFRSKDIKRIADITLPETSLYAVSFQPGSREVAVAGGDGTVRLYETETGNLKTSFAAAPVTPDSAAEGATPVADLQWSDSPLKPGESLPEGAAITELTVLPESVTLTNPFDYAQLLVTATLKSGDRIDVTRLAAVDGADSVAAVSKSGFIRPQADGSTALKISIGEHSRQIPVTVTGLETPFHADFVRDVNPVLSRVGCNQGTCHGAAKGKNGFKLSLRGYDPIFDVRGFTDDLASRRTNIASAADSLMLLKATAAVPHEGGQLFRRGDNYYEILRNWIAGGARLNPETPRVASISISPENPVIQQIGSLQQIRVVAHYADGTQKDVTREAFIESGNSEVAVSNRWGLLTAVRRGEAPVLARYEGSYIATTLTVMGDRTGFEWNQPETWGPIDELVAAKWQRMKIEPSEMCSDAEFLRRVYLDLTGLPPAADQVRAFLADNRPVREKRSEIVDQLVGNPDFVEFWTNKWADLLQVNRKFLGPEGAKSFRDWIRTEVDQNTPYNEFVRRIITAEGSNKDNPA
ncbi:MAG: DUF1549 domain-containing protein, partial [Planctomycetaceae bacterium]|nr:DUF1549 domain-containing protein [Planctomycetaceae bacterium]